MSRNNGARSSGMQDGVGRRRHGVLNTMRLGEEGKSGDTRWVGVPDGNMRGDMATPRRSQKTLPMRRGRRCTFGDQGAPDANVGSLRFWGGSAGSRVGGSSEKPPGDSEASQRTKIRAAEGGPPRAGTRSRNVLKEKRKVQNASILSREGSTDDRRESVDENLGEGGSAKELMRGFEIQPNERKKRQEKIKGEGRRIQISHPREFRFDRQIKIILGSSTESSLFWALNRCAGEKGKRKTLMGRRRKLEVDVD